MVWAKAEPLCVSFQALPIPLTPFVSCVLVCVALRLTLAL